MGNFFMLLFIVFAVVFFFWQEIIDFFLSFLPERVNVSGELVDVFTKPGFYPFFVSIDSSIVAFDTLKGIPVDLHYVKIWDPQKNEHKVVSVSLSLYEDMDKRLKELDLNVSIPCQKDIFTGELYAE